jgi:hypothetical protein
MGFEPGGTDANTFLAGQHQFMGDIVEVWGFFTDRSLDEDVRLSPLAIK